MLTAFSLVVVAMNVLLINQNQRLKANSSRARQALQVAAGTTVPSLHGKDIDANDIVLSYGRDSRKTLLMVFSPKCSACKENMSNWAAIQARLDPSSYRLAAVSLSADNLGEYLHSYKLAGIQVFAEIDPNDRVNYNLVMTPQTILIDSTGKVQKVWTGVLKGGNIEDLERTLDTNITIN
jgi:hypothetical protein